MGGLEVLTGCCWAVKAKLYAYFYL